jgi:phosphohistidine phosphatase SixA
MKIVLFRHGHGGGAAGEDAGLTATGRAQVHATARQLARWLPSGADVLLTSPAQRARQSAEILAFDLGAARRSVEDWISGGGEPARYLWWAESAALAGCKSIVFVGHLPDLPAAAALIVNAPVETLPLVAYGSALMIQDALGPSPTLLHVDGRREMPWSRSGTARAGAASPVSEPQEA